MPRTNPRRSTDATLTRRDFGALAAGGALWAGSRRLNAATTGEAAKPPKPLDIAEWSFFWVGVENVMLPGQTSPAVSGKQMYVEYQIPAKVRHPYPIVLIHGGGGSGLDWMGTVDGRRGWSTMLLEEGYRVYIVDRPGHSRSPYHPDLHGGVPRAQTLESISSQFTPMRAKTPGRGGAIAPNAHLHNQWPGTGAVDTPELQQLVASQGGSFGNGMGIIKDSQVAMWQKNAAELLDKIGPAVFMTHSAGGPFGFYALESRPKLVKGIVVVEGAGGSAFAGRGSWGLINLPCEFEPAVKDPSEIKTKMVDPAPEDARLGIAPYRIQEEPAHQLKNWKDCPIAVVTSEASFVLPNPGAIAFLKQAGVRTAEEIRLADHGVHGNGHAMMLEKNNREVLQPILEWLNKNVTAPNKSAVKQSKAAKGADSAALKLADQGYHWVGLETRKVDYGTILVGQMYYQYLIPQQVKHPYNVILVHGGGGQGTHYFGRGDGEAGWAHYFVQAGYKTYIVDRPGHGRAPWFKDSLGDITPVLTYSTVTTDFQRGAQDPNRRWMGSADDKDPHVQQFQAGQNSAPVDNMAMHKLWASRGAEMLDKIGPSIIVVHSAGGPFSWLVMNERPKLVKGIVNVEGAGATPFMQGASYGLSELPLAYEPAVTDPAQLQTVDVGAANGDPAYKMQKEPARKLKNFVGIPIAYVTAERSTRRGGPVTAYLKQAGCDATDLSLKGKGILGNGHFMMLETNRKQVFDAIDAWIDAKVRV